MASTVDSIKNEFGKKAGLAVVSFLTQVDGETLDAAEERLANLFEEDRKDTRTVVKSIVLPEQFNRLYDDAAYRVDKALLGANETRRSKKEILQCILARMVTSQRMMTLRLDGLRDEMRDLARKKRLLLGKDPIPRGKLDEILKIGEQVERARGYCGRIHHLLDDYVAFRSLAHRFATESKSRRSRWKSDVYPFQLDYAIRTLFLSRTEGQDGAPFLIRSLLETRIRSYIFRRDFLDGKSYVPKKKLVLSEILKACRDAGIEFGCPYGILIKASENLNLVLHFGMRLRDTILWSIYSTVRNVKPVVQEASKSEAKSAFRDQAFKAIRGLEKKGLVEAIDEGKDKGLTIYWRY